MDSDKEIKNIKDILEKEHGRGFTWEEATKAMRDIKVLARLAIDITTEQFRRKDLLKDQPKGFHLDSDGCSCEICGTITSKENSWFDKYGLKCTACQKAIDDKIIPGSLTKNKESYYSHAELLSYFNIKGADLNRYIKQSILKSRIVPGEGKKVHCQLFLIADNKGVFPPKKLLQSRTVKFLRDGEEYQTTEYWYEFIDHKLLKRLQKYKIVECLKETLSKPIEGGRFIVKTTNISPLFTAKKSN